MQFCLTHQAEVDAIVVNKNAPALIKFWIKSQGGAKRAATRMIGDSGGAE